MSNTQGLDALAALCGYTAAATEENAAAAGGAPANDGSPTNAASQAQQQLATAPIVPDNNNLAMASLYAQQMQQAQTLQFQQVQQALAMRARAQQQQQQQQAAAAQALQDQAAQQQATAQAQAQPASAAATLSPQLLQQLSMIQAAAVQQQQQQQASTYSQVQAQAQAQAIAAQLLAAQQQQQQQQQQANEAALGAPNLAALTRGLSPALATLAAAGGQVIPGPAAASALSQSPALQVEVPSPSLQVADTKAYPSPSTLAMPPPPKVVPSLPVSSNPGKGRRSRSGSIASQQPSSPGSKPKSRKPQIPASVSAVQPPIQDIITEWEDKKQAKRAANRLSAHLSRKRKKMFIEDLKDENEELRRKEMILRSIPDLIVVFDSSGRISFVSHAITRFSDYTAEELEETSFWDRLTEDSVRLIKSSFMDALAVKRTPDEDSTPLADGESMTVTMLHKGCVEGEQEDDGVLVSLKGVVHFAGESPECVCSIRPDQGGSSASSAATSKKTKFATKRSSAIAARVQRQEQSHAPFHQVSDIDSEKS